MITCLQHLSQFKIISKLNQLNGILLRLDHSQLNLIIPHPTHKSLLMSRPHLTIIIYILQLLLILRTLKMKSQLKYIYHYKRRVIKINWNIKVTLSTVLRVASFISPSIFQEQWSTLMEIMKCNYMCQTIEQSSKKYGI